MTRTSNSNLPIRVGIFDSVEAADAAVADLLAAGFDASQITVICSEQAVQRHFAQFEHQDPAGTFTPAAAATGGALGAAFGGLAALAGAVTMGGVPLLIAGGLGLWGGGVVGGLVGAMMTRGIERELADFYDQAVTDGRILVAAEQPELRRHSMLERAEEIFDKQGVYPLPLSET